MPASQTLCDVVLSFVRFLFFSFFFFDVFQDNIHCAIIKECNKNWNQTNRKPWPNGLASWCKLKTWVYLGLPLARPCMHLCWLAMTSTHFGWDQTCTQVIRLQVFHCLKSICCCSNLLANKIQDITKACSLEMFSCYLRVLERKLGSL